MPRPDPLPRTKRPLHRTVLARLLAQTKPGPRRRPPEGDNCVPAEPPRGPLPLAGGAQAPLD